MFKRTANFMVSGAVPLALFAAPAFALSTVRDDTPRKISGAGLVLIVSLQQRNG